MPRSHEIDYKIIGHSIQLVEVELDPNETVIAEAGAMMYMEQGIQFETKMGDGSNPNAGFFDKLKQVGSRVLTGESLFMTHFTNRGAGKQKVAFSAPYPGTIIALDLDTVFNNTLITQKDAFLAAALGTRISIAFQRKLGSGFFGGEGFILNKLQGDGMVFVHSGGTLVERQLNNETIRVDTGCVVAFEESVNFDVAAAGGLKSMIFGGEGMFLTTLSGTGRVWLQSMPISKLIQELSVGGSNNNRESGSVLGNLGGLLD
jgi:uncharacterized protein (TIGR00266 family)